jgi:ABC-2 type transport system ATP-binding protein
VSEPILQTNELTKVFRDFWYRPRAKAVDKLSLTVNRGEVYGLLGPNGSGKSTTIKLILGLLFPTSGQIAVFGRAPTNVEIKKRIGFLPEESYLYKYLNAEETLDFYARLFGLPADERVRRVDSLLKLTGLVGARKRFLSEYSKGMARRIGIAQALINDPELIILDEPTTGLDPIGTREIKDLILHLKEKGKTILLSSHLLSDVEDICDRIAILYGGRLQAEGETKSLLQQHRITQVTAEMDEVTVREVESLIRKRLGKETAVTISPPVERLEQFFLRVVEEARSSQATSGVTATDRTLDFITDRSGEKPDILQKLTRSRDAGEEESPGVEPAGPGPSAAGNVVKREVLENLAARNEPPAEGGESAEDRASATPENETRPNSVLEKLTRPDPKEEEDTP